MQLRYSVVIALALVGCGDDGAATLPDAGCPPGSELCGSICVSLSSDNQNCGACGQTCGAGLVCSAGTCALTCAAGELACNGGCIDPDTDRQYCGASGDCQGANAGDACGAGEICNGSGVCELSCQPGLLVCNGTCTNPDTDRQYCGATADCQGANDGNACGAGQICNGAGVCQLSCQPGLLDCNGTCIDPDTDRAYCGAIADCQGANAGTACTAGEVCNGAGVCELSCQAGLLSCGGTCIDPATDKTYCGAVGDCIGANDGTTCGANEGCDAGACRAYAVPFENVTFPIAVAGPTYGVAQLEMGFGGDLFIAGSGARDVFRVDADTGGVTVFGNDIVASGLLLSLVYDRSANLMYAGNDGSQLVRLDSAGTPTSIGSLSGQINTMSLAPVGFGAYGGLIIAGTTTGLYAVNPTTTPITVTTISTAVGNVSDLTFVGTTLYVVQSTTVRTVSDAGALATVGTITGAGLDGIVHDAARNVFYLADSNADVLWSMTMAGASTNLGSYDFDSGFFISGLLLITPDRLLLGTGESSLTLQSRTLP